MAENESVSYAAAGVDIAAADRFVERLKLAARRPGHDRLWKGAGGYAAVYPLTERGDEAVAVTTDGVGTKLLVAERIGRHDTIGIDLVAMCANDLICVGARPTLFLDYLAVGRLQPAVADAIIAGIVAGCDQAGMLLAGGETAEMPGVYEEGRYDLAGFAVGSVRKGELLTGERIRPGQSLVAVAASGIHSNGLSLARRVIGEDSPHYGSLMTPTAIYVKPALAALSTHPGRVTGIAHITGGGWLNLLRLNDDVGYHIDAVPALPPTLEEIGRHVGEDEMYRTFNMGMGLAVVVDGDPEPVVEAFQAYGQKAFVAGEVTAKKQVISIQGKAFVLKG